MKTMESDEEVAGGEREFKISLDSPNLFIRSHDRTNIWVYELEATPAAESSSLTIIRKENWTHLYCVGPNLDYTVLEVLGSEIDGDQLTRLAEDLCYSRLIVNSDGFCFLDTAGIVDSSSGFEYYRLNDVFSWPDYGVVVVDPQSPLLPWNRCNMRTGEELDRDEQGEGDGLELEELRREIESLQETLDEKEEEIRRLKVEIEKKSKSSRNPPPPPSVASRGGRNPRPGFAPPPPPPPPPPTDQPRSRPTSKHQGQTNSSSFSPPPAAPPPPPRPRKLAPEPVVEFPNKVAESNRRRLPPIKLRLSTSSVSNCLPPKRVDVSAAGLRTFLPYDEDVAGLFPRNVTVRWTAGGEFDSDNWWYLKAWESGAEMMIAYYEGEMDSDGRGDKTFDIPYRKGAAAGFSSSPQCFVGLVRGVGLRFMFVY